MKITLRDREVLTHSYPMTFLSPTAKSIPLTLQNKLKQSLESIQKFGSESANPMLPILTIFLVPSKIVGKKGAIKANKKLAAYIANQCRCENYL